MARANYSEPLGAKGGAGLEINFGGATVGLGCQDLRRCIWGRVPSLRTLKAGNQRGLFVHETGLAKCCMACMADGYNGSWDWWKPTVLQCVFWWKTFARGCRGFARKSFLCVSRTFIQGLVNVPIQHHPTIGDIISNRYWKVMFKISKKGHLPTSVARAKSPTSSGWRMAPGHRTIRRGAGHWAAGLGLAEGRSLHRFPSSESYLD